MPSVNTALREAAIEHAINVNLLADGAAERAVKALEAAREKVLKAVRGVDLGTAKQVQVDRLLRRLRIAIRDGNAVMRHGLREELAELARHEAAWQASIVNAQIPGLAVAVPKSRELVAAIRARPFQGKLLKDWFAQQDAKAQARVADAVRQAYVEGETTDDVVRVLRGTRAGRFKDGILEASSRDARAIARTVINHVSNAARAETMKANAKLLKGVEWVSTLDSRTTLICAGRDGRVYPVDSGPRPPAHFQCRSTTTPVLKKASELDLGGADTRESLDGQVGTATTFDAFLRGKPAAFQDEYLGPSRGRLFRQGKLKIEKFTDLRTGREFTLAELKRREPTAWADAGLDE